MAIQFWERENTSSFMEFLQQLKKIRRTRGMGKENADNSTPNVAVAMPEMPHKSDPEATFYWSIKFHFSLSLLPPTIERFFCFASGFYFLSRWCINMMEENNAVILFRKIPSGFLKVKSEMCV